MVFLSFFCRFFNGFLSFCIFLMDNRCQMYYLLSWSIMIDEIDHQPCHSTIYMQRTQNPKQRIQFVHWIRRKKLKNQILSGLITRNNEFIVLSFSENEKKKNWMKIDFLCCSFEGLNAQTNSYEKQSFSYYCFLLLFDLLHCYTGTGYDK